MIALPIAGLLLASLSPLVSADCSKVDEDIDLVGHDLRPAVKQPSYGACCDLCLQTTGCLFWSFEAATSKCALKTSNAGRATNRPGHISGYAGAGPEPPPPAAVGKWGSPFNETSCEQSTGGALKDLGHGIGLAACKSACAGDDRCNYINHADDSDHHCILYASCDNPWCRPGAAPGGWWTTYQFGRNNSSPWPGCGASPSPSPSPSPGPAPLPPLDPEGFDCKIRELALEYAKKALGGADVSRVQSALALAQQCSGSNGSSGGSQPQDLVGQWAAL
eukprot:g4850.t1